MNLLCPNCQKMVTVAEQYAGQSMKCPLCGDMFTVPALPQPPPSGPASSRPSPSSWPGAFTSPPGGSWQASSPAPGAETHSRAAPYSEEQPPPFSAGAEPVSRTQAAAAPPGYTHLASLSLRPQILTWTAPIAFGLVFFLLFCHWVGAYPGGHGVYTQSAWQALGGGFSADPVGNKEFRTEEEMAKTIGVNLLLLPYVLLLLAALAAAVAGILLPRLQVRIPPAVQRLWPWRSAIVAGLGLIALLLLLLQMAVGLGLENAVTTIAEKDMELKSLPRDTPEERERLEILQGRIVGQFNLHRTVWLRLAVFLHFIAAAAAGLEFWLERRGTRSLPRADLMW